MSLNTVITTLQDTLQDLGYVAQDADYLEIDENGLMDIPEPAQFVIRLINDRSLIVWNAMKFKDAVLQLEAFAPEGGEATAMLEAAQVALWPLGFKATGAGLISLGMNVTHVGKALRFQNDHD